jgi:hypothetical protein
MRILGWSFLVAGYLVSLAWFIVATKVTSSTFFLVGGSDVLAQVARHPESLRWEFGMGVLLAQNLAQILILLWRRPHRIRFGMSLFWMSLGIVALGTLNWSVFYDPHDRSVKSAAGGIVLDEVPLATDDEGPCVSTVEVKGDRVVLNGHGLRLRWWPLPLESGELTHYLTTTPCQ